MGRKVSGSYKQFRRNFFKSKRTKTQYCYICGGKLLFGVHPPVELSATIDHIKPLSKGGKLKSLENIRLCCFKCNCDKGDNYG